MANTFYISTPLYYPSGKWHLGHSYTTVCCDALARFKRMGGYDVFYLTGTDEHGQKIAERASAAGMGEKAYVDTLVAEIKRLWSVLDISYDKFIRTTDDYHIKSVQKIFSYLYEKGDIYKGVYKGHYCQPCEAFWTPSQLNAGRCPDCGRETSTAEEECYFFRLSRYAGRIEKLLKDTDFLQPSYRAAEMLNNFIKPGLNDLAVTRTSVKWGIPVESDPKHAVYVWIDALSNYITALGYDNPGGKADTLKTMKYWPCNVHMVGKEIVRFHAIIWPALLMALDLPLPQKVYGHGWLLLAGDKMSKSKGNVADPFRLIERYGSDAVRYYLLREIPFGSDGVYSDESFLVRYNSDLVNDLGNLVKRTVAMANKYFEGRVDDTADGAECIDTALDEGLIKAIGGLKDKAEKQMDALSCSSALEEIFAVVGRANKYIDETAPWILFKQGKTGRLKRVMYNLLEAVRVCALLLLPFIPAGPERIFAMLNLSCPKDFKTAFYGAQMEYRTGADEALYNRVDIKKELEELSSDGKGEAMQQTAEKTQKPAPGNAEQKPAEKSAPANTEQKQAEKPAQAHTEQKQDGYISIEDFVKIDLRIAEIVSAEKVAGADKLLCFKLKVGDEERTVVSGIAKHYTPDSLIGKKVVLLANLKPAKIRGVESRGMLLCASDDDNIVLLTTEKDVKNGSGVS